MASRAKSEAKPADPRGKIVDALMELASERRFEEISIRDICDSAGVSLAEFRDAFPPRGPFWRLVASYRPGRAGAERQRTFR